MNYVTEYVNFVMLNTPCCGTLLCYINSRMPNFCSECGTKMNVKQTPEIIIYQDDAATLKYKRPK